MFAGNYILRVVSRSYQPELRPDDPEAPEELLSPRPRRKGLQLVQLQWKRCHVTLDHIEPLY